MNVPAAVSAPTMQTGTLILGFTATGMIIVFLVLVALTSILAVSRSLRKPATYGRSASARKRMKAWQTYTDPRRAVLIGVSHYATKINEATVKERFVLALGRHPDSSSTLIAGGPAGSLLCGRNQRGR